MIRLHEAVPAQSPTGTSPSPESGKASKPGFHDILQREVHRGNASIRFSGHALQRIFQRNISISREDLEKIQCGVEAAREKGARDTLLLYKDHAFVVSVENRTVITARPADSLNVYTSIDSAVVIGRDRSAQVI
jgi:flagellar operon protein